MFFKTSQESIISYFEDASGLKGGYAEKIVIPENEQEIVEFVKECSAKHTPITISGGGTGVTGARIPFGGIILSLEHFNKIISIDKLSNSRPVSVVQPGIVVSDFKKNVSEYGWMYPPDPTETNSFLGGNVSTNASGSRGFKFGSTRNYINRLKIILSSGDILDIRRGQYFFSTNGIIKIPVSDREITLQLPEYKLPFIKNAAGYFNKPNMDLIDLFIGHEGTLGIITEIEVLLAPMIKASLGGIAFFKEKEHSWNFVSEIKDITFKNKINHSFSILDPMTLEYFDFNSLELLKEDYPNIPDFAKSAIFFEQIIDGQDNDGIINAWAELLKKHNAPLDFVWFADSKNDQKAFKEFRHRLPEKVNEIVNKNKFPKTGTDIAVPENSFRKMMNFYLQKLESSKIQHLIFGHIGENHMHANLLPATEAEYRYSKEIYMEFVENAIAMGGTVSAEHGIGKLKHSFLEKMVGEKGMFEMAAIKMQLDPSGILCPGNIFPADFLVK